jgi:hypothetical protein
MDESLFGLVKKDGGKPKKLTNESFALGPVVPGKGADLVMERASIIYYTLENGQLSGQEFQNNFFSAAGFRNDDNLNKAVYKMKSKLILTQNQTSLTVPAALEKFRQTITESLSQNK